MMHRVQTRTRASLALLLIPTNTLIASPDTTHRLFGFG